MRAANAGHTPPKLWSKWSKYGLKMVQIWSFGLGFMGFEIIGIDKQNLENTRAIYQGIESDSAFRHGIRDFDQEYRELEKINPDLWHLGLDEGNGELVGDEGI